MSDTPARRWPKGPFPDKYRWETIEARLAGGWDDPRRRTLVDALEARGWRAMEGHDDPYLRVVIREGASEEELDALRALARDAGTFAFRWRAHDRREGIGLVASGDPVDAVAAVGVAGPQHGVGTAAIVRFLVSLRSFARYELEELADDRVAMRIEPRDEEIARMIGERVPHVCPPRARRAQTGAQIAEEMRTTGRLVLDYA
ncbi:hypothetical protein [Sandaracinus amylolyticus]|uniref:Uncharacterized protein n=1 Tax=Sandaracinus amylolyticus TaxID=927083 RepID=A0A0F6W7Y7_9BACT|nr:hypothetical protein [Sandaracinus amylolyticus]AKF09717.1 hypothetical protein DB32_006866 [Sandaracinus amylolyticus]